MESEPTAAEHDGIPAVSNGVSINVTEVGSVRGERLPRHPNQLIPLSQDELRIEVQVRFYESAIPGWSHGSIWKSPVGSSARSKEHTVVAVHEEWQNLELADIQVAREADAVKGLVAVTCAEDRIRCAVRGWEDGRPLTDIGVSSEALEAQFPDLKRLAEGGVNVVASARGQPGVSRIVAEQRHAIPCVAVHRMAHQFHAELVVAESEIVYASHRREVVGLIQAAVVREE